MWGLTVLVTDFLKIQHVRRVKRITPHSENLIAIGFAPKARVVALIGKNDTRARHVHIELHGFLGSPDSSVFSSMEKSP